MHLDIPPFLFSYLLRITLVSAFLFAYYRVFLCNASFHPYNRRYLLASAAASLLLPLLYLPGSWSGAATFIVWANAVPDPALPLAHPAIATQASASAWPLMAAGYAVISLLFFVRLLPSLIHIARLSRRSPRTRKEGVRFYSTDAPGTPFSFGNRLFWNNGISLETVTGQAILRHEMTHIRGRHTLDILALEVLRCLFWINPFFHWMLREIRIIHEFLADKEALAAAADPGDYAKCLVWQSAGSGFRTLLAHTFFHTHLKRRITMIITTRPTRRYLSRILALPLFFLLFTGFAARKSASHADPKALLKFYNHQLRYPQAALDANEEGTATFTIKVEANGKLAAFEARPADFKLVAGQDLVVITVTARPPTHPGTASGQQNLFMEEVRKASNKLGENRPQIAEGVYNLSIRFRIERP
jgi:hypothetical protein